MDHICISCANCERKVTEDYTHVFNCKIIALLHPDFMERIEKVGCESWKAARVNYYEPYIIRLNFKTREVSIGKQGGKFTMIDENDFSSIADAFNGGSYQEMEDACNECSGYGL